MFSPNHLPDQSTTKPVPVNTRVNYPQFDNLPDQWISNPCSAQALAFLKKIKEKFQHHTPYSALEAIHFPLHILDDQELSLDPIAQELAKLPIVITHTDGSSYTLDIDTLIAHYEAQEEIKKTNKKTTPPSTLHSLISSPINPYTNIQTIGTSLVFFENIKEFYYAMLAAHLKTPSPDTEEAWREILSEYYKTKPYLGADGDLQQKIANELIVYARLAQDNIYLLEIFFTKIEKYLSSLTEKKDLDERLNKIKARLENIHFHNKETVLFCLDLLLAKAIKNNTEWLKKLSENHCEYQKLHRQQGIKLANGFFKKISNPDTYKNASNDNKMAIIFELLLYTLKKIHYHPITQYFFFQTLAGKKNLHVKELVKLYKTLKNPEQTEWDNKVKYHPNQLQFNANNYTNTLMEKLHRSKNDPDIILDINEISGSIFIYLSTYNYNKDFQIYFFSFLAKSLCLDENKDLLENTEIRKHLSLIFHIYTTNTGPISEKTWQDAINHYNLATDEEKKVIELKSTLAFACYCLLKNSNQIDEKKLGITAEFIRTISRDQRYVSIKRIYDQIKTFHQLLNSYTEKHLQEESKEAQISNLYKLQELISHIHAEINRIRPSIEDTKLINIFKKILIQFDEEYAPSIVKLVTSDNPEKIENTQLTGIIFATYDQIKQHTKNLHKEQYITIELRRCAQEQEQEAQKIIKKLSGNMYILFPATQHEQPEKMPESSLLPN